jgi:hypothetical protein
MSPFNKASTTTRNRQPNGMHRCILNFFLLLYSATVAVGNPTTGKTERKTRKNKTALSGFIFIQIYRLT